MIRMNTMIQAQIKDWDI